MEVMRRNAEPIRLGRMCVAQANQEVVMSRGARTHLVLFTLLLVSGCSTIPVGAPTFSGLESPKDGEAIVYFYRPKNFTGGGVRFDLHLDQDLLTTLPNCSFTFVRLLPGNYTLTTTSRPSISQSPDPISFEVKSGDRQFYLLDIDGSFQLIPAGPIMVGLSSTSMAWRSTQEPEAIKYMSDCYSMTPGDTHN